MNHLTFQRAFKNPTCTKLDKHFPLWHCEIWDPGMPKKHGNILAVALRGHGRFVTWCRVLQWFGPLASRCISGHDTTGDVQFKDAKLGEKQQKTQVTREDKVHLKIICVSNYSIAVFFDVFC